MSGKAVLTCRPNSHPFPERTLALDQPVKIGRSVARARPASNNAIFDCKVLSRNHALIWYNNGKFYLQDTKSSNGTFVNNHRLSKSGEESLPREVCSGDIVQFGVDVLENTRKVTHGCIIANLKLFLPDGKEAKASLSTSVISSNNFTIENLYEINQYLQEASQREQLLVNKLKSLQEMFINIKELTDQSWKALIAEDRLLTRIDALESQLVIYSKNFGEDKLKEELKKLQEFKNVYQNTAKEFLKKLIEEKHGALHKHQEVKRNLETVEAQYSAVNEDLKRSKIHIQELALKLSIQISKNEDVDIKMQEFEEHRQTSSRLIVRIQELEKLLEIKSGEIDSQLVVDLRAPGSPGPFAYHASPVKELDAGDGMKSDLEDEDLMKKDAADLFSAQLELLQLYGSENHQSLVQTLKPQIRSSDKVSNGCEEELDSRPNNQILLEDEDKDTIDEYCANQVAVKDDIKTVQQDDFENHLNKRNQGLEEKDFIRKELLETEQCLKKSRNEVAQLAEKVKILTAELETLKQQQQQALDNKLREELSKLEDNYFKNKEIVSLLKEEISSLNEDRNKLYSENAKLMEALEELEQVRCAEESINDDNVPSDEMFNSCSLDSQLEERIVHVSQLYMQCVEDKAQLRQQLDNLTLDYQAISNQPYFNLFFVLPCIMISVALTIVFYPTLSNIMGTADPSEDSGWFNFIFQLFDYILKFINLLLN